MVEHGAQEASSARGVVHHAITPFLAAQGQHMGVRLHRNTGAH